MLLNHGADISCLNTRKQTPFHAYFNPMISQLAQHCSDSMNDTTITPDAKGMTLAHYFSWTSTSSPTDFQFPNLTKHLITRDAAGKTPLHFASQRGNIPVMKFLLSQYQNPATMQPDNEGNTALHEAVQSSRAPAALALLLSHGFSIEQRNKEGHSVVQYAVLWGTVAAMETLFGCLAWRDDDAKGMIALARKTENEEVEAWLLERGYGGDETGRGLGEAGLRRDVGPIEFARVGRWRRIGKNMLIFIVTMTIVYTGVAVAWLFLFYEENGSNVDTYIQK